MNWYTENIEEGVRDLVRLLRDNGFNTECSCHHDMYIQCQYVCNGSLFDLHNLIYNYLYERGEKLDYRIEVVMEVKDGHQYCSLNIDFSKVRKPVKRNRKKEENITI